MKTITFILLLLSFNLNAQERVNRQKLNYISESQKVDSAVGWKYSESNGEWIDYGNMISENKIYKKYITPGRSYFGFGPANGMNILSMNANFLSIQTKTFKIGSKEYYALIVEHLNGYYKYPNIKEEWRFYKDTTALILEKEEYYKMFTNDTAEKKIKVSHVIFRDINCNFIDNIQTGINLTETRLHSPIFLKRYKNLIRFYIPYLIKYNPYFFDFNKEYFETTFENFDNLEIK